MSKITKLARLIEQEKLLYLEVEQLRYSLYLHDDSFLFHFLSVFTFAFSDIAVFFSKKSKAKTTVLEEKKHAIQSLQRKKNNYLALQRTPYAWIIFVTRKVSRMLSFRALRPTQGKLVEKSPTKKSFVIYGSTECDDLQSRSVQIARTLSEKHSVLYIEGVYDEGIRSGFRITEDSGRFKSIRLTTYKSFHLNYQRPAPEEIILLKRSLKLVNALTRSLVNPLTYIHHPFWDLLLSLKKKSFIFDRACSFAHHHNAAQHIIDAEKKLLKNALIITAPHVKLARNKKDRVIKNGVDFEMFKDTSKMIQTCDVGLCWIKKPVMGYIGTLDEQVDEVLLGNIATAFPTASLVLVGNTDYRPAIEVAEKFPNIFPVGKQPYKKLPLFLQSFDILIAPFKYNKSCVMDFPELPLYLSSGKPIVASTSLTSCLPAAEKIRLRGRRPRVEPERRRANGLIYKAKTHADWMLAIAEALKEKPRSKKKFFRIAMAKKLSWNTNKL